MGVWQEMRAYFLLYTQTKAMTKAQCKECLQNHHCIVIVYLNEVIHKVYIKGTNKSQIYETNFQQTPSQSFYACLLSCCPNLQPLSFQVKRPLQVSQNVQHHTWLFFTINLDSFAARPNAYGNDNLVTQYCTDKTVANCPR